MVFLYKLSALYAAFLKVLGYERGINRFLDKLELKCPPDVRILDVGCGSGLVGLRLLERFPRATLLATDLEPNFLKATLATARERKIDPSRITVGVADVSAPKDVALLDGKKVTLEPGSFDIVSVGGVLGYSKDKPETLRRLLELVRPGGYLVNLEMNEKPAGKFVASIYSCRPAPISEVREQVESSGHRFTVVPFSLANFPANLTRVGIVAHVGVEDPARLNGAAAAVSDSPLYKKRSDYDYSTQS